MIKQMIIKFLNGQLLDIQTKLPSNRLCLCYQFNVAASSFQCPSESILHKALQEATIHVGYDPDIVTSRIITMPDPTLQKVHHLPYDPTFHVANGGPSTQYEFVFDNEVEKPSKMIIRIVTSLGDQPEAILDGVTASRIAFHALELLEGNELSTITFPCCPKPLLFGPQQEWNQFREIHGTQFRILLSNIRFRVEKYLGKTYQPGGSTVVNTLTELQHFYNNEKASSIRASYRIFRSEEQGLFRSSYLKLVDDWRIRLGLKGYFYLMNFGKGGVAPGTTNDVFDIGNRAKRYEGAFFPAGAGPPPPAWNIQNAQCSRIVFVNNYGVHKHNFSFKPESYIWDWIELAAPLHGAGCISINGTFLCFARALESSLKETPFEQKFGKEVERDHQNDTWFGVMGPWDPTIVVPPRKELSKHS
jgi:hypothetical protein